MNENKRSSRGKVLDVILFAVLLSVLAAGVFVVFMGAYAIGSRAF